MPNNGFEQRPDSGALFTNDQQGNEKWPQIKGTATLSPETVSALMGLIQAGQPAEIEIAGWHRQSTRTGQPFVSIKVGLPRGGNGAGQQRTQAPNRPPLKGPFPTQQAPRPTPRQQAQGNPAWGALGEDDEQVPF